MRLTSRAKSRDRILAIALTLLAHGLAVLLTWVERRGPQEVPVAGLQYISIWPQVRVERQSLPTRTADRQKELERSTRLSLRSEKLPPQLLAPATVTEPPQANVTLPDRSSDRATMDWNAAAKDAAARIAGDSSSQRTFSAAPQALRKPCKARVFDEDTRRLMDERLPPPADPDLMGANPTASCIVVGGYPKCVQKFKPKVRQRLVVGDLHKESREGKGATSSVPSPGVCE